MNQRNTAATYLVIGAGGAQGGAVARELARRGMRVRGFGRRRKTALAGGEWVGGDLADAGAVAEAFTGVTHASVTLPLTADVATSAIWVRNVVAAAAEARLERLVFNTSNRVPAEPTAVEIFESRRHAASAMLDADVPVVVLRPPVYLENLLAPGVIGVSPGGSVTLSYPLAADRRVAWLSHDDLAAITVATFHADDLVDATVDIGGTSVATGPELAAAFSAVRNTDVTYHALPADVFEQGLASAMGPVTASRVASTYRWLDETGTDLYDGDPEVVAQTFGISLTPLRDWIATHTPELP